MPKNNFKFSQRSIDNLKGVNDELVEVCHLALSLSDIDFGVSEGLRTLEQQKEYVAQGKSQTLNSKHLSGDAIDVYAYVGGSVSWDVKYYIKIAEAFRQAAKQKEYPIRWGGSWTVLNSEPSASVAYNDYIDERRDPFIDAPHFEIIKD